MASIGVFLANGFEEIEALTVVDLLRRANQDVSMISISEERSVMGAHEIEVIADLTFEEGDFESLDMIVLPGGMPGTNNLGKNKVLMEQVKKFCKTNKYVGAICAAPSLLGALGLLKGKEVVCYPGFEDQLKGGLVRDEEVVKDGNIITAKGMGCAIAFSLKIVEELCGDDFAKELKKGIIYNY